MQRLFAGTPFDRPATCDRCGQPEGECKCPPPALEPVRLDPAAQTAQLRREKRARGKVVTIVEGLEPAGNDLSALAGRLKTRCGAGGTVKEGRIELQGDRLDAVEAVLLEIGYRIRRR
jgi:translation initiation factor 1